MDKEEVLSILEELQLTVDDLEDIEVLCGCTGLVCQTYMIY